MEEKARARIIESAILEGDGIEVAYVWYGEDPVTTGSRIDMLFRFNGKDQRITATLGYQETARTRGDKGAFIKLIVEKIAAAIAVQLHTRMERR